MWRQRRPFSPNSMENIFEGFLSRTVIKDTGAKVTQILGSDDPPMQVFRLDCDKWRIPMAVKITPMEQLADEQEAWLALHSEYGFDPLMCLPTRIERNGRGISYSYSAYAGPSLDTLVAEGGAWHGLHLRHRLPLAEDMAAALLLVRKKTEKLGYVHSTIQLSNICYSSESGLFVLKNFEGWKRIKESSHEASIGRFTDWHAPARSPDSVGASCMRHTPQAKDGQSQTTLGLCQIAAAVTNLLLGKVPDPIHQKLYGTQQQRLQASWQFDWSSWPDLALLPKPARDFVLRLAAADPSSRPQTADEALQDPFVQDAVQRVQEAAEAAAPGWINAHNDLKMAV